MHNPLAVGLVDRPGDGPHQARGVPEGTRGPVEFVGQTATGDVLHLDERMPVKVADRVDLDDVGMLKAGDRLGLGQEPGLLGGRGVRPRQDHLKRHHPV